MPLLQRNVIFAPVKLRQVKPRGVLARDEVGLGVGLRGRAPDLIGLDDVVPAADLQGPQLRGGTVAPATAESETAPRATASATRRRAAHVHTRKGSALSATHASSLTFRRRRIRRPALRRGAGQAARKDARWMLRSLGATALALGVLLGGAGAGSAPGRGRRQRHVRQAPQSRIGVDGIKLHEAAFNLIGITTGGNRAGGHEGPRAVGGLRRAAGAARRLDALTGQASSTTCSSSATRKQAVARRAG